MNNFHSCYSGNGSSRVRLDSIIKPLKEGTNKQLLVLTELDRDVKLLIEKLSKKNENLCNELKNLNSTCQTNEKELHNLRRGIQWLKSENEQLQSEALNFQQTIQELKAEVRKLKCNRNIQELPSESQKKIEPLQPQLTKQGEELNRLAQDKETIASQLNTLPKETLDLEQQEAEKGSTLGVSFRKNSELTKQVNEKDLALQNLKNQIQTLESEFNIKTKELESVLQKQITSLQSQLHQANLQNQSTGQELQQQKQKSSEDAQLLEAMQKKLDEKDALINVLWLKLVPEPLVGGKGSFVQEKRLPGKLKLRTSSFLPKSAEKEEKITEEKTTQIKSELQEFAENFKKLPDNKKKEIHLGQYNNSLVTMQRNNPSDQENTSSKKKRPCFGFFCC